MTKVVRQSDRIDTLKEPLPRWFRRLRRDMPWRTTSDPYAIWISEIMLQQTQVATVKPYYRRFLSRFPDVRTLAEAPLDEVLKTWEGLGYYRRARNLHEAAAIIVADFGGRLPKTAKELLKLPGIGRYTAGAIASIAFGADEPVIDGNVARVLCRVFCIRKDPSQAETQKKLWRLAHRLIPAGQADVFNQAMMDLGATICQPRSPQCEVCPIEAVCLAKSRGKEHELPMKRQAAPLPHVEVVAGIVWKNGRLLIDQRKPEGLLGGLWEFPGGKRQSGETLEQALVREINEELNVTVTVGKLMTTVNHAYSHFRITLHAFECSYVRGRPKAIGCAAWKWIRPDELREYAFPKANHKIISILLEGDGR